MFLRKLSLTKLINIKDIFSEFDKKVGERLAIEGVEKKTTIGGKIFEDAVTDFIVDKCSEGVITEAVGNIAGAIPHAKKGDVLITMGSDTVGAGRKIVVEIKNEKGKTYQSAIDELIEAKRNRKADVGVFVFQNRQRLKEWAT